MDHSQIEDELKRTLEQLSLKYFEDSHEIPIRELRSLTLSLRSIAIGLILHMAWSIGFIHKTSTTSSDISLISEYHVSEFTRPDSQNESGMWKTQQEANLLFDNGDFESVALLYRKVIDSKTGNDEIAEWNLVLVKMSSDDESYKQLLHGILSKPSHQMHTQATELNVKLNSIFRKF